MTHRRCLIGIGSLILAGIAPALFAESTGLLSESAREKKIRKALQTKMDYSFDSSSLSEVVEFLEERHEIDIHIDQHRFESNVIACRGRLGRQAVSGNPGPAYFAPNSAVQEGVC